MAGKSDISDDRRGHVPSAEAGREADCQINGRCSIGTWTFARYAATLALGLLLAGISTALAGEPPGASTPKTGGDVTERLDGVPTCLDMAKPIGFGWAANNPVMDTLMSFNQKGKLVPYLAQKYTVSKSGKSITFFLHHGVEYSDGRQLVAADVKADFERILDPATKSPYSKGRLGPLTSIDTSGKYDVRLNFSESYRPVLLSLTSNYLGIMDPRSVTAAGSNTCNGLVGSGPFKIASVDPGYATIREVRNSRHTFGPGWASNKGSAYLSSLTFVPITSDTTAVSELLSGQLDITDVPGTELSRVQGSKSIRLYRVYGQQEDCLVFNSGKAPFNNVVVRRAVAEAIDRKAVLTGAAQGLGKVSTGFLPPSVLDYDPNSAKYVPKLNLVAARTGISAAGATGPYTLLYFNAPAAAAELIQGELAQVGMQVNVAQATSLTQLTNEAFDMLIIGHGSAGGDPNVLYSFFHSSQRNGGLNWTNVTDPTLDALLQDGRTTLNLKKARADYFQAQKIIDTKVYIDPLWVPLTIYGVRSRVQGWKSLPNGQEQYQDLWVK
jgi:peptide/nickel transport system substrate-binding protein